MLAAHAIMFQVEDKLRRSVGSEHLMLAGAYQAIKWGMEYASDQGADVVRTLRDLERRIIRRGAFPAKGSSRRASG
jgi:hypothetical protein